MNIQRIMPYKKRATSALSVSGDILNGSKNVWGKYINTTVYQITHLHFGKQITFTKCGWEQENINEQLGSPTTNYMNNIWKLTTPCTYKSLWFLGVMQKFFGGWISNQLPKLVGRFSRNLQINPKKRKMKKKTMDNEKRRGKSFRNMDQSCNIYSTIQAVCQHTNLDY